MIPPDMLFGLPDIYLKYMESVDRAAAEGFARDVYRGEKKEIPIWFLGVWDTVGALWRRNPNHAAAHQVELPSNVSHAYHGLALHEVRSPFKPVLCDW